MHFQVYIVMSGGVTSFTELCMLLCVNFLSALCQPTMYTAMSVHVERQCKYRGESMWHNLVYLN
jgi:hypothetical protein